MCTYDIYYLHKLYYLHKYAVFFLQTGSIYIYIMTVYRYRSIPQIANSFQKGLRRCYNI